MAASLGARSKRVNATVHTYYEGINIVVKEEMLRVFHWLYQGGRQYVGDYLYNLPYHEKQFLKLTVPQKEDLKWRLPPEKFDIAVLYIFLQFTCGLKHPGDCIWFKPKQPNEGKRLEHSLYFLKEKRNIFSHDGGHIREMTISDLDYHLDDLSKLCEDILQKGGMLAGKSYTEVNTYISRMKEAFQEIKTREAPSGMTAEIFSFRAKDEIKKKHRPSNDDGDFIFPSLQSKEDGIRERNLKDLLQWRCGTGRKPEIIVITGETGIGKTTLCRFINDSWISNPKKIDDMDGFDLVFYLQCSSISTRNFLGFLKNFIGETINSSNTEEVHSFLKQLRILWLVDGYGEATKDAVELIKVIIHGLGSAHLMFITTQPQSHQDLMQDISSSISTDRVYNASLTGFSEKGIWDFITRALGEENANKFVDDVEILNKDLLNELGNPLRLQLMVKLWQNGKLSKESTQSVFHLYESIMEVQIKKLKFLLENQTRLSKEKINKKIELWVKIFCKITFEMTMDNVFMELSEHFQKTLVEKTEAIFPFSAHDVLSLFLYNEITSETHSYSLLHNTQQIHYAAQHVSYDIIETRMFPSEYKERLMEKITSSNSQSHYHLYLMLLQVELRVAKKNKLFDRSVAKDLVAVLSEFRYEFDAFRIVQHANNDHIIAEEVVNYVRQRKLSIPDMIQFISLLLPLYMIVVEETSEHLEEKHLRIARVVGSLISVLHMIFEIKIFPRVEEISSLFMSLKCLTTKRNNWTDSAKFITKFYRFMCHCIKIIGKFFGDGYVKSADKLLEKGFFPSVEEISSLLVRLKSSTTKKRNWSDSVEFIAFFYRCCHHYIGERVESILSEKEIKYIVSILKKNGYLQIWLPKTEDMLTKYIGHTWNIYDKDIMTSKVLLSYFTPSMISINASSNPENLNNLPQLLENISKKDIQLLLSFSFHINGGENSEASDRYLKNICSTDAKCHLLEFQGHLSLDGMKLLRKMTEMREVHLLVTSDEVLNQILMNLKYLQSLQVLKLTLMIPAVRTSSSHNLNKKIRELHIRLPIIDKSKVKEIAESLAKISNNYETIELSDISAASACKFIQILKRRDVRVNIISRYFRCPHQGEEEYFIIDYGPIPLTQSLDALYSKWYSINYVTYEDDLGMKRRRLNHPGIPICKVDYSHTKYFEVSENFAELSKAIASKLRNEEENLKSSLEYSDFPMQFKSFRK